VDTPTIIIGTLTLTTTVAGSLWKVSVESKKNQALAREKLKKETEELAIAAYQRNITLEEHGRRILGVEGHLASLEGRVTSLERSDTGDAHGT
jgi:hypothetical protein